MSGFYNLRTTPKGWQVTKFDEDFNVESSYEMTQDTELRCGCPAGARPNCRHREMFPFLLPKVDTAWFLDHDTYRWVDPTGEARRVSDPTTCDCLTEDECDNRKGCQVDAAASAASSNIPEDVTVVGLSNPIALHNAIAEGIGEPEAIIKQPDSHPFRRRM